MVKEKLLKHHQDNFWDWSCVFYEASQVKPLLLKLQDSYQLNVNYVLLALWAEDQGIEMDKVVWKKVIRDGIQPSQAVSGLRHRRRKAKHLGQKAEYQKLLTLELKGEKLVQQQAVKSLLPFWPIVPHSVEPMSNLRFYIETQAQSRIEADEALLEASELGVIVQKLQV
ncbi:TIGR02444 family protein [Kangiella koreensis]|uniref:TIGR02444 family protein n=1 Tax=Kangiella koreensis (strain DSM 16069 / JCM 12317 / KCTC 12182 / SW-125) TaxID=523791 RepID=C7R8H1_KANKD|nr:TIGR02444 family protein [Kangiella koreensis]ACV27736.1 hypothetical protein Kkor_2327 [Kangiella koreensis DSM 16069]